MDIKYAQELLNKTRLDYNRIAEHFSKTRTHFWDSLKYFENFVKNGDKILDLGCGNGRLLELLENKNIEYVGLDYSWKLIKIAKRSQKSKLKNYKFIVGNALNLPFKNNSFDKIFSIAVFHHIPSTKFRLQFLKEAKRVLKPKGLLILSVWNLNQKKFFKYRLKHLFLKLFGKSKLDFKDIFYPWKSQKGKILVKRYLHCFSKKELKKLVQGVGFKIKEIKIIEGRFAKNSNILLVAEK